MTLSVLGAVFFGGAIGALLRFLFGLFEARLFAHAENPKDGRGTMCANLLACFFLGFFYSGQAQNAVWDALWIAGLCGGLSTFSSLALEVHDWLEQRRFVRASVAVVLVCIGGLATMWLGSVVKLRFV